MAEATPEQKARATAVLKWAAENKPGHGFHEVPGIGVVHFNDGSEPDWAAMAAQEERELEEYTASVAQILANNTTCTLKQARNLCGDLTEMMDEGLSPDQAAREIAAAEHQ